MGDLNELISLKTSQKRLIAWFFFQIRTVKDMLGWF